MVDDKHISIGSFITRLRKGFIFGTAFGGIFGAVISFVYLLIGNYSVIVLVLPVCTGILAGLAGLLSVLIEQILFYCGLTNKIYLNLATFIILIILAVIVLWIFIPVKQKEYLIIAVSGCLLGAAINFYNYRFEKIRQRMATLELENKFLGELAAKDQKLQELTNHLAVVEERNRMARELHDSISQGIHGIVFAVNSLKETSKSSNSARMTQTIHLLEKTAEATLDELRAMITELKPASQGERDLLQAIRVHCEIFAKRQQIELDLDLNETTALTPSQEMLVYRLIQEALANIQRHAGASQVKITCERMDRGRLCLIIADNGRGFDTEQVQKGNGLYNMAERCRENGAKFGIVSQPGAGTRIEVIFH
ncbi:MAG TPA: sensor histidine kinase [Bacillota bacterium]|nr:sensor histidine kinase [Bacillota bacterium]